jgi:hypothetical protein
MTQLHGVSCLGGVEVALSALTSIIDGEEWSVSSLGLIIFAERYH